MEVPQAVLEWDRGALEAECDRAATVQTGVETYLGRSVFSRDGTLVVRVALSRVEEASGRHVVANVTQRDASGKVWGERTVSGDDTCASLDEQLTLVVALLVDAPAPPEEQPPAEPAPEPSAPPPPPPPAVSETGEIQTAPSLERLSSSPSHAAFLALGAVSMGSLPGAGIGGRLLASVKPRDFIGFGVDVLAFAPQRKALGAGAIDVSFVAVAGSVCPLQGVDGRAWYSACASFGAARVRVAAKDLLQARSQTQWLALPSLSARGAWLPGGCVLLGGGLDAAFPLSADRYVYRDPQGTRLSAFELGQLVITASLGVGLLVD
jgi:hypothetical protein